VTEVDLKVKVALLEQERSFILERIEDLSKKQDKHALDMQKHIDNLYKEVKELLEVVNKSKGGYIALAAAGAIGAGVVKLFSVLPFIIK